jgi:hypothetical protein
MNIKNLMIGGAVVLAAAGAAGYGVNYLAQREAQIQVEASFAGLPPAVQARHGAVSYSIIDDRLVLADVSITSSDQWLRSFRAARVEVTGVNQAS